MYFSLSLSLCLSLSLSVFWSGPVTSSLWSSVSKVTSPWDCSLKVLSKCICLCHCLCLCLCICLFFWSGHVSSSFWSNVSKVTSLWDRSFKVLSKYICHCLFLGQVMSPHHSDQMSQRSQVSRVALYRCSLNVFAFVTVWVIVIWLVRSCIIITLIICLKGHKSLWSLFECVL